MYRFLGESGGCPSVSLSVSSSRLLLAKYQTSRGLQKSIELLLQVLEVGHVAGGAEQCVRAKRVQALDVTEARERAVRSCRQLDKEG